MTDELLTEDISWTVEAKFSPLSEWDVQFDGIRDHQEAMDRMNSWIAFRGRRGDSYPGLVRLVRLEIRRVEEVDAMEVT